MSGVFLACGVSDLWVYVAGFEISSAICGCMSQVCMGSVLFGKHILGSELSDWFTVHDSSVESADPSVAMCCSLKAVGVFVDSGAGCEASNPLARACP